MKKPDELMRIYTKITCPDDGEKDVSPDFPRPVRAL